MNIAFLVGRIKVFNQTEWTTSCKFKSAGKMSAASCSWWSRNISVATWIKLAKQKQVTLFRCKYLTLCHCTCAILVFSLSIILLSYPNLSHSQNKTNHYIFNWKRNIIKRKRAILLVMPYVSCFHSISRKQQSKELPSAALTLLLGYFEAVLHVNDGTDKPVKICWALCWAFNSCQVSRPKSGIVVVPQHLSVCSALNDALKW